MAGTSSIGLLEILAALFSFISILLLRSLRNTNDLPWNFPFLGMVPTIIHHSHRIHDRATELLRLSGCSFLIKGIWFANLDMLLTADPANIHHIMSANFVNFPKGPGFKYIFDILGDGIFNSDADLWKDQRRIAQKLVSHKRFYQFMVKTSKYKVEKGLVPILDHVSEKGLVIDFQDLFQRFSFDSTCMLVTGFDPTSLSIEFPDVPFSKAMDDAEEVIFYRHFIPKRLWELQKFLGFGLAKRLGNAWETIDETISELITMKKAKIHRQVEPQEFEEEGVDLIESYMNEDKKLSDDKFLRDTILNFMIAGRDTTSSALSWFFWLISKNPLVLIKIREELKQEVLTPANEAHEKWRVFDIEEVNKLVYLHAALCESLRLYPPVPFQHKEPVQPDILPSGHHVSPKIKVLFSMYALGRMESVWGKDCEEFNPERWISVSGKIKHKPSYKFMAFNAGPRTCLGKEVAFTQMKLTVAAILHNYDVEVVEGQHITPSASIILHIKHGLKIKVTKRWT